jgi:predicted transcriptional regulator of viral defense system
VIAIEDVRICMLNGMHTGQLGVISMESDYDGSGPARVRVTNLERTLIDIAVRPFYAGGVTEVLTAFERAQGKASANRLVALLRRLNYVYPYHQAIGFYMERAGYSDTALGLLRELPRNFDFYLTNQMRETDYVSQWRLHVPKGL